MKKYLNEILAFWSAMPAGGKFFWSAVFVIFILPHIFIFIVYHTLYAAPWQKYFDVSERQILTIKGDKLYLTNFYLCDSRNYRTFNNSIKNNFGSNMCGEEILIMENVKADKGSPQEDYYLPKNFSSAILSDNKIAWAFNDDPKHFVINLSEIVRDENNNYQISNKTILNLEKFDLGTYADNLKNGKPVPPLSTVQKQTGHIWTKPFLVEDDAVVFYDAIVTKIDHEKPVEAMSRKWKIFADGRATVEEGERETIDNKFYMERQKNYQSEKFNWDYMSQKNNWSFGLHITKNYFPFHRFENSTYNSYYSPDLQVNIQFPIQSVSPLCDNTMLAFPCNKWIEQEIKIKSIKLDKEYSFQTGTILYFNMANFRRQLTPIDGVNNLRTVSQNEELVAFYQKHIYLLDLKTGGRVKVGERDDRVIFIK